MLLSIQKRNESDLPALSSATSRAGSEAAALAAKPRKIPDTNVRRCRIVCMGGFRLQITAFACERETGYTYSSPDGRGVNQVPDTRSAALPRFLLWRRLHDPHLRHQPRDQQRHGTTEDHLGHLVHAAFDPGQG